jgi:hypothetical protein
VTPTVSGFRLLPMMAGLLVASITSGQLISRSGHHKISPIIGTALMTAGLLLLSHLGPRTSPPVTSLHMFVFGLGLGSVIQVLVIAVQNAVAYKDLGTATSGVTYFHSIGGSFGTAVAARSFQPFGGKHRGLSGRAEAPPRGHQRGPEPEGAEHTSPGGSQRAHPRVFQPLQSMFLAAAPVAAVGFVLSSRRHLNGSPAASSAMLSGSDGGPTPRRNRHLDLSRAVARSASRAGSSPSSKPRISCSVTCAPVA